MMDYGSSLAYTGYQREDSIWARGKGGESQKSIFFWMSYMHGDFYEALYLF
jgi:hypothetical protein